MTLVAHNALPTFERLRLEGQIVLSPERASAQDIRPLHIGLLNMMPDSALQATERQFLRLIGASNPIAQFRIHLFSLDVIPRSGKASEHLSHYYESFDAVRAHGLDALIVSGANVTSPDLQQEVFWDALVEVIDWADQNVTSTLCSCLATHAVLQSRYGIRRRRMQHKRWGVYRHRVTRPDHPLVGSVNTLMDVPHSRFNDVSRAQLEAAGLHVLVESETAGVQLAVSPDGFRTVFFQGHPEYDRISLMKEYKRDLALFQNGELTGCPPLPQQYFDAHSQALLTEHVTAMRSGTDSMPPFPESLLVPRLHNTWHDSGLAVVGNWIGLVYQLTHAELQRPFMESIDRDDPLRWSGAGC